jgi:hypothetical protein
MTTTETFDGVPLTGDAGGDDTRSFGDSPRFINGWTISLVDVDGNNVPGDGPTPSYLDVTGNGADTVLVGAGDNALSVNGWLGVAAEAQFAATGGEEFWLQSFHPQNANMLTPDLRVLGYRNGVLVASQDFTAALGADTLVTLDQGADKLFGGTGNDFFRYEALTDSPVGPGIRDTIVDFAHGEDKISLHALDADTEMVGNQAFSFIGNAAFSGKAGQLRYTNYSGNVIVYADVNGDSAADMQILVAGTNFMTGTDFIL